MSVPNIDRQRARRSFGVYGSFLSWNMPGYLQVKIPGSMEDVSFTFPGRVHEGLIVLMAAGLNEALAAPCGTESPKTVSRWPNNAFSKPETRYEN